jgi:hypothetical protein
MTTFSLVVLGIGLVVWVVKCAVETWGDCDEAK